MLSYWHPQINKKHLTINIFSIFNRKKKKKRPESEVTQMCLLVTPWTVYYQAPPSMGFSRQEYWSGLTFPSPGDLPDPGIEPRSPTLQADSLPSEPPEKPYVESRTWYNDLICKAETETQTERTNVWTSRG